MIRFAIAFLVTVSFSIAFAAEDRAAKVRRDPEMVREAGQWIYNDFAKAQEAAKDQNKPLLVVFRCIP